MKSVIALAWFAVLCNSGSAHAQENHSQGEHVSIIQLIAAPEKYHGKVVFLSAYATIGLENMSLCMSRQRASSKDCLWLQFDDGPWETREDEVRYKTAARRWAKFNGKRISLRGTFNMENTGHFGGWSGAIEKITDVHSR